MPYGLVVPEELHAHEGGLDHAVALKRLWGGQKPQIATDRVRRRVAKERLGEDFRGFRSLRLRLAVRSSRRASFCCLHMLVLTCITDQSPFPTAFLTPHCLG